jgi:glycosyltransferase involved in cell wall biosynthesis
MIIGICMIVKDEERVIERCLRSVLESVQAFCIVDTGSSDRTKEIIRDICKDLPGEVYERPWVHFGHNRTEALALAKKHMDFALMMDADDIFHATEKIHVDSDCPGYMVRIKHGGLTHRRPHLFNLESNWSYTGSVHEYANSPFLANVKQLENAYIEARTEGARSNDPQKYLKDAMMLLKEHLQGSQDPGRTLFYLAQSFRDANLPEYAKKYYLERAKLVGWQQEAYVSYQNLVTLSTDVEDKIRYAWASLDACPWRREAVYEVLCHCRKISHFTQEVFALGLVASMNTKANDSDLFVKDIAYSWSFDDEFSIVAYYTKHPEISKKHGVRALENAPSEQRKRILENIGFCK